MRIVLTSMFAVKQNQIAISSVLVLFAVVNNKSITRFVLIGFAETTSYKKYFDYQLKKIKSS